MKNIKVFANSKVKGKGKVSEHTTSKNIGEPRPSPRPMIFSKVQTNRSFTSPVNNNNQSQPSQAPIVDFLAFMRVHVSTRMADAMTIQIPMEAEILGYEHTLRIGGKDAEIGEIINHEWLSQSCISVYLRYYIKL